MRFLVLPRRGGACRLRGSSGCSLGSSRELAELNLQSGSRVWAWCVWVYVSVGWLAWFVLIKLVRNAVEMGRRAHFAEVASLKPHKFRPFARYF